MQTKTRNTLLVGTLTAAFLAACNAPLTNLSHLSHQPKPEPACRSWSRPTRHNSSKTFNVAVRSHCKPFRAELEFKRSVN